MKIIKNCKKIKGYIYPYDSKKKCKQTNKKKTKHLNKFCQHCTWTVELFIWIYQKKKKKYKNAEAVNQAVGEQCGLLYMYAAEELSSFRGRLKYEYRQQSTCCIWIPLTLYAHFSLYLQLPELHVNHCTWLGLPWILGSLVHEQLLKCEDVAFRDIQ